MGRNHISQEAIEQAIQSAFDDPWNASQEKFFRLHYDSRIESLYDREFSETAIRRAVWNHLTSQLENPYPLGRHIYVVPEFGFTKRDLPVKITAANYDVETYELENETYSLWHLDSRGFVVYPGEVRFGSYQQVDAVQDGTPIIAFGDADDFADYLMEFDRYIPRMELSREDLIIRAKAHAKATELLQVTVKSMMKSQKCNGMNLNNIVILGNDTVHYAFERYGLFYEGECGITELNGRIYAPEFKQETQSGRR